MMSISTHLLVKQNLYAALFPRDKKIDILKDFNTALCHKYLIKVVHMTHA